LKFQHWRCIGCGVCIAKCDKQALRLAPRSKRAPVPKNYGQMIVDSVSQLAGVQKYTTHSIGPRFTNMLGDWIQRGMTRKMRT